MVDSDHSWDFSNHVYTMGCAFVGYGNTAEEALANAVDTGAVPPSFEPGCPFVAIPESAEVSVDLPADYQHAH